MCIKLCKSNPSNQLTEAIILSIHFATTLFVVRITLHYYCHYHSVHSLARSLSLFPASPSLPPVFNCHPFSPLLSGYLLLCVFYSLSFFFHRFLSPSSYFFFLYCILFCTIFLLPLLPLSFFYLFLSPFNHYS